MLSEKEYAVVTLLFVFSLTVTLIVVVSTLSFGNNTGPCLLLVDITSDVDVSLPSTISSPVAINCPTPAALKVLVIVVSDAGKKE